MQSTCPDQTLCAPLPGGYCTAPCGAGACPAGSACVPTGRMGELCMATCRTDADCRADQGYACDPERKVCFLPGVASPKLKECPSSIATDASWSPLQVLTGPDSPGAYQFEPSGVVTPAGDVVIVHTGGAASFFAPSFLTVTRIPAGGAPEEIPLPTTKRQHFDAWAAIDKAGTVHAVWLGHDGGGVDANAEIGYARSTDAGKTWSTPIAVHDPSDCADGRPFCLDKPMIAIGPRPGKKKGEVIRVFYSSNGMRQRESYDGGKTWREGIPVIGGTYGDVTVDDRGVPHIAVLDQVEGEAEGDPDAPGASAGPAGDSTWGGRANQVVYTVAPDGTAFTTPVRVSAAGESIPFFFVNPSIAVDRKRGWIYIAYAAGGPDGAWNIRLATSHDGGRTWKQRTLAGDEPACAHHAVPELALSGNGLLFASWYEYAGGAGYRAFTRCAIGGEHCNPAQAIGPPMATYLLTRHSPHWLGEYTSWLVDDKHHQLHAIWTQIIGDGNASAARIVHTAQPIPR